MFEESIVSFVVPLRERQSQVDGCIETVRGNTSKFELILCHQADRMLFKRGQLCNLGYKESKGEIVVFLDVDMRFIERIDFRALMNIHQHPYVPFRFIDKLVVNNAGYVVKRREQRWASVGGCCVFTKEQFEKCHGFSNLCVGWGWEDDLLNGRVGFKLLEGRIGHLTHNSEPRAHEDTARNRTIAENDCAREACYDGYLQTIARKVGEDKIGDNIRRTMFLDITVPPDFKYADLLVKK